MRPTSDRVRESLFSVLGSKTVGANVLDVFAGSGALGLESLSRGASSVVFIEKSRHVQTVLRRNVSEHSALDRARIIAGDARRIVPRLAKEGLVFDLLFMDPPYAGTLLSETLSLNQLRDIMNVNAVIIAEHQVNHVVNVPKSLRTIATRSYGGTVLSMIERAD